MTQNTQQRESGAGVGLRLAHIAEVVATRPSIPWFEIHPENFLANPHARELLVELSRDYSISVHSVGISIRSVTGIDHRHLKRVRSLVDRIRPKFISGHLAWSTYGTDYLNDLLPLPYTEGALRLVEEHLRQVQDCLGLPYLIENPASYVGFGASTMSEAEFFSELVTRTGCRLLCDISNAWLSAHNMGYDAYEYIDNIPPEAVAEMHLGGYTPEDDEALPGRQVLIDTHAQPIAQPSWDLYQHALGRFGPTPTLVEWDNDLPPLSV